MKADIINGVIMITPETSTEDWALDKWMDLNLGFESNCKDPGGTMKIASGALVIETKSMEMTIGA